ncbi:MAG: bifunctional 3-deoxy-7-phosphoheptulonate synthase/chorismate mutase type II [Bacteroidales bacterium]|nr:bifunctional 3-deoxy-7-phosphoheptulonate synthase/chorismate mutase type II [Bacteroidales bacterium]MDD5892578.1 bifunctional 3-deoxy-7-phosphoheptulonate synthase/chorismate mutase type II [Bacteroidales bacterium]MDY5357307.1 bifunctional 3-deoxy-7-phosphoheptulonate synthase/chorismate mutase type II [Candidatus Cryptobacteroides sp.]
MANKNLELIPLYEWGMFTEPRPSVIAGPCSAETEEQVMQTAAQLKEFGINVFRAGIWKPRTHPGCFEGVGTPGLKWMQRAKRELGLKIATEVASEKHVFECLKYGVDLVWLGARTTANPFLVQEIADALKDTDIPVLVKNPVNPDLDLWIGALERLNRAGIKKLGVIHRGFSTSDKIKYRNNPDWQIAIELRSRYPQLPFFVDPSHMAGSRDYIREISQRSLDLGFEGLMIESHCDPSCAMSDAKQQLTPAQLEDLLYNQITVRDADSDSPQWKDNIDQLRAKIDIIDENILYALGSRMKVSRQIGEYKKNNNIAILQASRWDAVLEQVVAKGMEYGLDEKFITTVFNAIHEASVEAQNEILSGSQN